MLPCTRACSASSTRSAAWMSPTIVPLTTTTGARASPSTRPCSEIVSTALAPSSAQTLPWIAPSTYRPPVNTTSPRITACGPISVSTLPLPLRGVFLSPNISFSTGGLRLPVEGLVDGTAARAQLHPDALGGEIGREGDAALELLEITEGERLAGRIRLLQQLVPRQR